MNDVVDRGGRRRDAVGRHFLSEHRVHERRLAVIELAEHDEMKPLVLQLRDPGRADVVREPSPCDASATSASCWNRAMISRFADL